MIAAACVITVAVSKYSCLTLDLEKSVGNVKKKRLPEAASSAQVNGTLWKNLRMFYWVLLWHHKDSILSSVPHSVQIKILYLN